MATKNVGKKDAVIIYPSEPIAIIRKSDYENMQAAQVLLGDILLTASIMSNAGSFHRWVMSLGADKPTDVIMAALRASEKWGKMSKESGE